MTNVNVFRFLHSFVFDLNKRYTELLGEGKAHEANTLMATQENRPQSARNMDRFLRELSLEGILVEYQLIQNKQSALPRTKRDAIVYYVDNILNK